MLGTVGWWRCPDSVESRQLSSSQPPVKDVLLPSQLSQRSIKIIIGIELHTNLTQDDQQVDCSQECSALTPPGNGLRWKIFLSCVLLAGKTEIKVYKEEQCTQHWGPINGFVDNAFSLYILPALKYLSETSLLKILSTITMRMASALCWVLNKAWRQV